MTNENGTSLPANIREFNEIVAVIFAALYEQFPIPMKLEPSEVAHTLGTKELAVLESGRPFNQVFAYTLERLIQEGSIDSHGSYPRERCVLTTRALTVMNSVPEGLQNLWEMRLAKPLLPKKRQLIAVGSLS